MASEHMCGKDWAPGGVDQCKERQNHGQLAKNQTGVRWGRKVRAKADRAAGTVGQDRGGYINGPE
jgi:hypothetical protein